MTKSIKVPEIGDDCCAGDPGPLHKIVEIIQHLPETSKGPEQWFVRIVREEMFVEPWQKTIPRSEFRMYVVWRETSVIRFWVGQEDIPIEYFVP